MSERGVFALDRGWFSHPMFLDEPFTQREAWAWLIAKAAWKPYSKHVLGKPFNLERGQLVASYRYLAEQWKWSLGKTQRYLGKLKNGHMIRYTSDTGINLITICNYNKYQRVSLPNDTLSDTPTDTGPIQDRYKEEDIKDIESITIEGSTSLEDAVLAYNEAAERVGWPKVSRLTASRKTALRARLAECGGIHGWKTALGKAEASDFLTGRKSGGNGHENWTMTFDFLVKSSSFTKIMEGSYDNRPNGSAKADPVFAAMGRLFAAADNLEDRRR